MAPTRIATLGPTPISALFVALGLALAPCAPAMVLLAGARPAAAEEAPRSWRIAQAPLPTDETLWQTIRDSGYVELYEFFLAEFPASRRAEEARAAIAILKGEADPDAEPESDAAEAPATPETVPALDPRNLDVAAFQAALRERGCNAGLADGIWGERTAAAAQRFADALGLAVDPSRPNVALFQAVFAAEGDVCGEV